MTPRLRAASALLSALVLLATALSAAAQTPRRAPGSQGNRAAAPAGAAKLARLLDQSGLSYTKVSETVWTAQFKGESLGEYPVIIATVPSSDLIIIGVVVVPKAGYRPAPELFQSLLRFNDEADQVKVGIDSDGDIFLRAEMNLRLIDLAEFKAIIDQVAAAANQVHSQSRKFFAAAP
jgi:hypothetical protein